MIESTESRTRDIPVWLTALVLLLCIGGGSWLVYWAVRDRPREVVVVPEDKNAAGQTRTGFKGTSGGNSRNAPVARDTRNLNADGVTQLSKNTYRVKSGNTAMNVSYATGRLDFSTLYLSLRTAEQAQLAIMRVSIIQDSTWREYLKVTPEQIDKLMKVPQAAGMKLDPADRARLTTLWNAYHEGAAAANKPAAEKALVAALDEIGKKNLEATKQEEVARAEAIRSALTAEQLKLYRDSNTGGTRAPVPPKAKPAALAPAAAAKQDRTPDRTTADLAALPNGPATGTPSSAK